WILTAAAVAASVGLVVAAWVVDRQSGPKRSARSRDRPVADLVVPEPLSDQERAGTGPRFGSQEAVRLEQGAWVQVADAAGNLKQQYTASRIDPLPDKRLAMKDPRAPGRSTAPAPRGPPPDGHACVPSASGPTAGRRPMPPPPAPPRPPPPPPSGSMGADGAA
ncbi:MAG: hypothetical protein ACKOHI_12390, partial [Phycisphaerales bacterium]